ncbi:MAG TPA: cobalt-precorrin-5B (C(1))-methyltransferase [Nitrosopumilaceae archaeon]|nr:cobalt-precorrin-5B (C(1))-methyltransferase [Nitrosopumilaceae archaeon]
MENEIASKGKLRTGFTTGTCATAGAKAGILSIMNQAKIDSVKVILPKKKFIDVKISNCQFNSKSAKCMVIKDGGDDPDVTHGAEIWTEVFLTNKPNQIEINGGEGVGRVTKPGLGLDVGSAAINPTPKKMISENILDVAKDILKKNGINIVISVPKGKELAPKTDNPRLGILGGISILGTSGIVIPYSTASFAASIRQSLDVTIAMGNDTVVLTTGGRSEDFARTIINLPDHCFVQMGDFSGYAVQQCAKKKIKKAYVAGFIGKLTKMAMGVKQTHVKGSKVDMEFLSKLAQQCNADVKIVHEIKKANTARHVFEIIVREKLEGFFDRVCFEVYKQLRNHSENEFEIDVIMFDFEGKIIGKHPKQ